MASEWMMQSVRGARKARCTGEKHVAHMFDKHFVWEAA
jgi:hypothetical protein